MPARRDDLRRKLQPKLRMVANGSTEVNALRSERTAAIKVSEGVAAKTKILRAGESVPASRTDLPSAVTRGRLARGEFPNAEVSLFVQVDEELPGRTASGNLIPGATARRANLLTAVLPVEKALELREQGFVEYVELGQTLAPPLPTVAEEKPAKPSTGSRRVRNARVHRFGEGVLVGLIDVGGFDFAHADFLDRHGGTRFIRIWDQGGSAHPPPAVRAERSERPRSAFDYGAEFLQHELDNAIVNAPREGLPAHMLEPQSVRHVGSHGTHVASIAAGNRGICRKATIAGVLIALPDEDIERRTSFYDSTRIVHAVDYLLELADELDLPVSINISLGTNGHAHDDSSPVSRWVDAALTKPGRSVTVAAGNAGQERPDYEGDIGFVVGRIHAGGRVPARGLSSDLEWNVVGNGVADLSENEMEIWYSAADRFAVRVKPPGEPWTDEIEPGEFIENRELSDGTFLSVYNELYHPANGCNYISLYLSPFLREPQVVGVQAGQWLVRLIGREVRDGRFDCWIERDDPRRLGRLGSREAWEFPSFFSERSYLDKSTVSSLACGQRVVSVANLDVSERRVNVSSSQGPTRDGREKPEIAAPGTDIVAAKGFAGQDDWISMSGTSMAAPHVAGLVGLMLAVNPHLSGAQIGGILRRTARPLPGTDFTWRDDAGFGELDVDRALDEAATMLLRKDVT